MAQDFLLNQPKGITALTLTLVGYAVGTIRQYIVTPSPLLPVVLVGGATLVGNRSSTVVLVDRRGMQGQEDQVLFRLSNLVHVPVSDMLDQLNSVKYLPYQPVPVAQDVPQQTIFYLEEHHDLFPGVSYEID